MSSYWTWLWHVSYINTERVQYLMVYRIAVVDPDVHLYLKHKRAVNLFPNWCCCGSFWIIVLCELDNSYAPLSGTGVVLRDLHFYLMLVFLINLLLVFPMIVNLGLSTPSPTFVLGLLCYPPHQLTCHYMARSLMCAIIDPNTDIAALNYTLVITLSIQGNVTDINIVAGHDHITLFYALIVSIFSISHWKCKYP